MGRGFLDPTHLRKRALAGEEWQEPPQPDPLAAVVDFRDRLAAEPAYITLARGGAGFAEVAAALLDSRAAPGIR